MLKTLLAAFLAALVAVSGVAGPALAEAAYYRVPSFTVTLAADGTVVPPWVPDSQDNLAQRADLVRPRSYIVAGKDGVDFIVATTAGVIQLLYDRATSASGINWFPRAPAGSQQFALVFRNPVLADGCDVIIQSRGTPTLAGVRFQYQDANDNWSAWTPLLGEFNTAVSGNKLFTGRCGIPEGGTLVKAVRVAPPETFPGEIWLREFRVSLHGVSAP